MRESMGSTKPKGGMKVKGAPRWAPEVGSPARGRGRTTGPSGHLSPLPLAGETAQVRRSRSVHVGTRKMVNYA